MTIKVTIKHDEPNNPKSIYVKKVNGNIHELMVEILPGESLSTYVYDGQDLIVTEKKE